MIIYKEDIIGAYDFNLEEDFDFSKIKVEDALIDTILMCHFKVNTTPLNEEDFILNLEVNSEIKYLDAKTLEPLNLKVDFCEEVPFSFDKNTADELDIDFFDEELDLKELVYELLLLNIPFNYSENKNEKVLSEKHFATEENQNKPFAQIFQNKEKE